ncbi:MarR family winged helix-turn-helix transcriptional regulator [Parvularcula sp. LCG005]|uniref:MarR family winged helix-turn-helix transcriptional regulator n=1 Tax=Parvularcula sp. LCG005 TaxID=3078805 RepID=UPI002942E0BB|nr:MarR family winged helix-turn-helix transcriptional regulator [Parvularcula sp. LCG005]WOI53308.1 MarR family winged helix-turn-helix transcriptional regulator [Parvularcula sp. LCG005]
MDHDGELSLGQAFRRFSRLYAKAQRDLSDEAIGLPYSEGMILTELLLGPRTQQELALILGADKTWISRSVRKLVDLGAITRMAHHKDGRAVVLDLTPKGFEIAEKLDQALAQLDDMLTAQLTDRDRETLHQLLPAMTDTLATNVGP